MDGLKALAEALKACLPEFAEDLRLNCEGAIGHSSLSPQQVAGVALAAAFAVGDAALVELLRSQTALLDAAEAQGSLTAASLLAMNNVWYTYVEMAGDAELSTQKAELRMNAYATHGISEQNFELYALAASIVGRCDFCVKSHFELLRKSGLGTVQLRDVGRIAAVVAAVSVTGRAVGPAPPVAD